jgi:GDP/GTP exchange factor required for growth at low temperature
MAAGDYTNEEPRFPTDSDSDEEVVDANEDDEEDHESVSIHNLPNSTPSIIVPDDLNEEEQEDAFDSARTPIPTQSVHMIPHPPGLESALQPTDVGKLELEVAVFSEVIPDQITFPATKTTTLVSSRPETVLSSKFANSDVPRIHKSLVLNCRTTTLAEYFTMIDRELIAHFVMISEIVLTRPAKRHFVVAKFLKVAWVSLSFQHLRDE